FKARRMSMVGSRGTAMKVASGASGRSAIEAKHLRPPNSLRLGFTTQIAPEKPVSAQRRIESSMAWPPTMQTWRGFYRSRSISRRTDVPRTDFRLAEFTGNAPQSSGYLDG